MPQACLRQGLTWILTNFEDNNLIIVYTCVSKLSSKSLDPVIETQVQKHHVSNVETKNFANL